MGKHADALPPHYRWNFSALLVDYVCFGVAFSFINPNSVLPAFIGQLTDSAPVIGLVGTIFRGGWLLPQLAAAHLIKDKPRRKPYVLAGASGRIAFWVMALALWAGLARYPSAVLILFFACLGLWAAADGVASVAWFDIFARAIPLKRRGRLVGVGQVISGLAGIGVGTAIGLILNRRSFPDDYALLFALAGAVLVPSIAALALVREPLATDVSAQASGQVKHGWLKLPATDPDFRRLMLCRTLIGMLDLATPFYVGHAEEALHLPVSIVGGFVIAQALAGVFASTGLSLVFERWGSRYVVRIGSAAAAMGPLFALAAHLAGGGWLARAYPFVYVALGVVNSAWMMGFFNYLLEIAPDGMYPAYVGLGNTIMGALTLVPMAGGWLLEATSYTTLFGVTAALVAAGFLLALGLRSPQRAAPVEDQP
jgi:hypothetical protein